MTNPKANKISEAPESNAGDDFHKLWAVRKSLELLNHGSNLKSVTVEGPDYNEGEVIDETGEKLLSIDTGEYYGGEDFESADRLVFSQLKYSTRQSKKTFTLARLTYEYKDKSKSILGKLARTFLGYYDEFGRDESIKKIKLKLVTNRPIEDTFLRFLSRVQKHLDSKDGKIQKYQLQKKFPEYEYNLRRIQDATKLNSIQLVDFLRVLDFKDCGTEPRFVQKQELIYAIDKYGSYDGMDQYNRLYMLVNSKMMPEAISTNAIKIDDVLAAFGLSSLDNLYPVIAKLSPPANVIHRKHWEDVCDELLTYHEGVICVHGVGGIGKSTFIQELNNLLPDESKTVIYDCYGQGTYFDESAIRHTYKNAVIQICNDLANLVGSPLLLSHNLSSYDFISELRKRIEIASKIIGEVSRSAILTLVIDAADNSVFASKNKDEECFVSGIISLTNLPKNCRIILTSRTGRLNEFEFSSEVKQIELQAFCQEETGQLLKSKFPHSTVDEIKEFHELTNRIPRVQVYSIDNKSSLEAVFAFLKPYGENVNSLIAAQIIDAKKNMVNRESIDNLLSNLIHLPRPIPIDILSKLSKVSTENITDFCVDLWSGIVLTESMISFRDEDFENYLRAEYKLSKSNYSAISDELLKLSETDGFSCEQLGYVLYRAGKYKLLQEIVLGSEYLGAILDPIKKREISINRTRYAILSCDNSESTATFFKLLYLSAEASKTNKARMQIIAENIDLISEFTELRGVQKLFFEITSDIHYGAANLQCASIFSKNEKTILFAKRHLRQAEAWIEMRNNLDEEELSNYEISDSEIAKGAMSILRIFGYNPFEKWLRRWKPRKIMLSIIEIIIDELLIEYQSLLMNSLSKIKRRDVLLVVIVKILEFDDSLIDVSKYSDLLIKFLKEKNELPLSFIPYAVSFCEVLSMDENNKSHILEILDNLNVPIIDYAPSFYSFGNRDEDPVRKLDVLIRLELVKVNFTGGKLKLEELIPNSLKQKRKNEKNQEHRETQLKELKDLYGKLIPIYEFRFHLISSPKTNNEYNKINELLKPFTSDYSYRHSRRDINGLDYFIAGKLIEMVRFFPKKDQILTRLIEDLKVNSTFSINTQFLVANEAVKYEETKDETLHILTRIEEQTLELTLNAHEIIERYVSCARLAIRIDKEEAEIYFQKAVNASTEIDLDAFDKLKTLHYLTGKLKDRTSSMENQGRGFRLAKLVESAYITLQGYDHFPWERAILAIQNLSIETSLVCRCRWDHMDYISVFLNWSNTIDSSLDAGLSIEQACGLIPDGVFDREWDDLILKLLDKSKENELLQSKIYKAISEEVKVYTRLDGRTSGVKLVLELLDKSQLSGDIDKSELEALSSYLNKSKTEKNSRKREQPNLVEDAFSVKLSKSTDHTSGRSISESLVLLTEGDRNNSFRSDSFFTMLKSQCKPNEVTIHLNALLEIDSNLISSYALENVLKARLQDWGHRQVVKRWKKESFQQVVVKFLTISELEYLPTITLLHLVELFDSTRAMLAKVLKSYFTDNIEKFSVELIYQSIEIFHHLLEEHECAEVIDWALSRWELVYQRPLETLNFEIYQEELPTLTESFAYTLRYCLAHPDKRVRWDAINTIRRLVDFGDSKILNKLIELRDQVSNECFKYEKHPFFWISSKLWLFLVVSKLSESHPEMIIPHFSILKAEAERTTMAHVLIRYYAKLACEKLYEFDKKLFKKSEFQNFMRLLTPIDKGNFFDNCDNSYEKKFPFDELDTIPYWYDNLGDLFKVEKRAIAKLAEEHIYQTLNYSGNPHKDEQYSVSSNDYYLTSNRQGSIPTVEKVRSYHEYHSMFYVANDLIENYKYDETHWRDWSDWLDGWLIAGKDKWLEDYRQETPKDDLFWKFSRDGESSKSWLFSINLEDFKNVIQFRDLEENQWNVISCSISRHDWKDTETISVNSALVSEKGSHALVRSLQTCESYYDYKLPRLDDERVFIDFNGFKLRGFYQVISNETKEEEELNYRINTLMNVSYLLEDDFTNWISQHDEFGQEEFGSLMKFENWSDHNDKANHSSGFGTKGYRLIVRSDVMRAYLAEQKEKLIVECVINRSPEKVQDMSYIDGSFKLFLINEDGIEE